VTAPVAARDPAARSAALRKLHDRDPQWWLWPVAAAGWTVLGALFVARLVAVPAAGGLGGHVGHSGHAGHADGLGSVAGLGEHAVAGIAMVAVMAPLIVENVRFAARRSPRRARGAVTRDVVAGWALGWIGAAVVLGVGGAVLVGTVGNLAAVALLTVVAVGWQYTARKRRGLARCHALFAPPLDRRRSGPACRRYGWRLGRDCVLSCGPLMGLMVVAAHNPFVVAASMATLWYERRRPHHDPATRPTSVAIAATGAVAFVVASVFT
jgi:hypothetical protein